MFTYFGVVCLSLQTSLNHLVEEFSRNTLKQINLKRKKQKDVKVQNTK